MNAESFLIFGCLQRVLVGSVLSLCDVRSSEEKQEWCYQRAGYR